MKILVTGGAGFIGSTLVDRLLMDGHEVAVVDNLSVGQRKNVNRDAIFYHVDIASPKVEKVFKRERPEIVNHHAAQRDVRRSMTDPLFDAHTNIMGTLNILQNAVRYGTKRVIFASSGGAVYGESSVCPTPENHPLHPTSPYGLSKQVGEQYLSFFKEGYGLEYTILRYGNVYGPRQDPFGEAGVVAIFTMKMLKGEQPVINGNGRQTRDYIYVDDVVDINISALSRPYTDVFNVGTGTETSVNQIFQYLKEFTGAHIKEVYGPGQKGEQIRSSLDCKKSVEMLRWEPRVSLQEGLQKTVEYFRGCRNRE